MLILELINLDIYCEALGISRGGCAQESRSEIVTVWTVVKPKKRKGKDIIIFKQNCSGISLIITLDKRLIQC